MSDASEKKQHEKLLHERLRKLAETPCPLNTALEEYEIDEFSYDDEVKKLFTMLANEIECNYIPRPRFDDDKPVDFRERMGNGKHVRRIIFREDGWTVDSGKDGAKRYGSYNSGTCNTVPRYREPVLDADGVEIKVGDTIYFQETGNKYTVVRLDPKDEYHALLKSSLDGKEQWHCIARFTHERPVFDAEGVRICKGDTDCWTKDGRHVEVLQVGTYQGGKGCLVRSDKDIKFVVEGKDLTHLEPDSIARVVREIRENASNTDPGFIHTPDEYFIDRLTALIERGA